MVITLALPDKPTWVWRYLTSWPCLLGAILAVCFITALIIANPQRDDDLCGIDLQIQVDEYGDYVACVDNRQLERDLAAAAGLP